MTFWCLYSNQQIKTGKVAHLLNVYFWNGSDNGFRVNDSVSNNNTVLASGFNLIWIHGNTQFQTCQYWNLESKQTSQKREEDSYTKLSSRAASFHTCVLPPPDRLVFQCFRRPSESPPSRLTPLSTLQTCIRVPVVGKIFRNHTASGAYSSPSVSPHKSQHKVQTP